MSRAGIEQDNGQDRRMQRLGEQSAVMVTRALDADWGCFYFLDDAMNAHGFHSQGTPVELRHAYVEHDLAECDPLHPRRLVSPRQRFAISSDPCGRPADRRVTRFWRVMRSFGARVAGELVFWESGRPVGGLSLIWRAEPATVSLDRAFVIHDYVEFALDSVLRLSATGCDVSDTHLERLTIREREVVQLLCRGHTNGRIAGELRIGLATVKTHLLHVFAKMGVENRAELIALLMQGH